MADVFPTGVGMNRGCATGSSHTGASHLLLYHTHDMTKISNHPPPGIIRAVRAAAGLTQTEAASVVHVTLRSWQNWEADEGSRDHHKMPVGLFELFCIKTGKSDVFASIYGSG